MLHYAQFLSLSKNLLLQDFLVKIWILRVFFGGKIEENSYQIWSTKVTKKI